LTTLVTVQHRTATIPCLACKDPLVNRKTLDAAIPMIYGILVVVMYLVVKGSVATVVTVVGAMLVGLYFAALRRNLPQGPDQPPTT
jgi:hypothetical protein